MKIIDLNGNVYEYNPENGLISINDVIVSGAMYEPVFAKSIDDSFAPIFVGIWLKSEHRVLTKSGGKRNLVDSKSL